MSNETDFYNRFKNEFSEREFNPDETMQWLTRNKAITMSWGFQKPLAILNSGLMFKVNGHHHKGWVLITLAGNDTYTVRFFSFELEEAKDKITNVYCDELQERIDNEVEKLVNTCFK